MAYSFFWFLTDLDAWGIPEYNSTNYWPYFEKIENATDTGYYFHWLFLCVILCQFTILKDSQTEALVGIRTSHFLLLRRCISLYPIIAANSLSILSPLLPTSSSKGNYYWVIQRNLRQHVQQLTTQMAETCATDLLDKVITTFNPAKKMGFARLHP